MSTLMRWLVALVFVWLALAPSLARAEPTAADEERGKAAAIDGMGHYKDGDFEAALESFRRAEAVYPAAQVLRMKGYSLMALENWLEAADAIEMAIATDYKPLGSSDRDHAEEQLKKVLSHLALVSIRSNAEDATVAIDGQSPQPLPATIRILPGLHRFVVEAPDHEPEEKQQTLAAGKHSLAFDLTAIDDGAPDPRPVPGPAPFEDEPEGGFGWFPGQGPLGLVTATVGLAVGGTGLGLGLYGTSLRRAVQRNIDAHNLSYDRSCSQDFDLCNRSIQIINNDGRRARDLQNTGMVMGIAGGGLFVVGTLLFLFSDDSPLAPDDHDDKATIDCGPGGLGFGVSCHGSF